MFEYTSSFENCLLSYIRFSFLHCSTYFFNVLQVSYIMLKGQLEVTLPPIGCQSQQV